MIDEQMVREARQNDDAFYALIVSCQDQLYRIAFSYLKSEADALEAIQETTYRAYKNLRKLKNPKYFKTWLIRILINYCIDELKQRKRHPSLTEDFHGSETNIDPEALGLRQAVDKLDDRYRQIVMLKYFEGFTIREIADMLESPEGTIKTWLNRALTALRNDLGKDGESYA